MGRIVHCTIKGDGFSADALSKNLCAFNVTVGNIDRLDPVRTQMLRCQLRHLSRTEDQRTAAPKTAQRRRSKLDSSIAHRHRTVSDARFRPYAFSRGDRTMEEQIEYRSGHPCLSCQRIRLLHL